MIESPPWVMLSTLLQGLCHGAARNNQLFICHQLKLSTNPYAEQLVRHSGYNEFLKMLDKNRKHQ